MARWTRRSYPSHPLQLQEAPDLLYQVFYSVAFAPIFNLPEVFTNFVFTVPLLAKSYTGQIQYWDDPEVRQVNQRWALPHEQIALVLNGDCQTFIHQFTQVLGAIDPLFAALIQPSPQPVWPTGSYAKFHVENSIEGPISRVTNSAYSMTISLVAIAKNMGGRTAQLVNAYGTTLNPDTLTIASALNEKVVKSSLDATGKVTYSYNFDLSGSSGVYAFPFIVPVTLVLRPRSHSRTTCRAKSELVKFWRWMPHSDAIRYTLAKQEYAAMTSTEVDLLLQGERTLSRLTCGASDAVTNSGAAPTVSVGGAGVASSHTSVREFLLQDYSFLDSKAGFSFTVMDEGLAVENLLRAGRPPDVAWFQPMTFATIYPEIAKRYLDTGLVTAVPQMLHSVVPTSVHNRVQEKIEFERRLERLIRCFPL
jgi:ABC-type phosphate transport system substrate-binding protein